MEPITENIIEESAIMILQSQHSNNNRIKSNQNPHLTSGYSIVKVDEWEIRVDELKTHSENS